MRAFILIMLLVLFVSVFILIKKLKEKNQMLDQQMADRENMRVQMEQEYEKIWKAANIMHLYATLSEEEAQSEKVKEKQREILRQAEILLQERKTEA